MIKKVNLKERNTNENIYPVTSLNCVNDFPKEAKAGLVLTTDGLNLKWTYLDVTSSLAYGVEWDINVSDPHLTRIGNMSLHKALPIQSQLRGCIAQGGKIMYWLDENDWKYKKGGNPSKGEAELLARLDGYDGTVRVYCPEFFIKSEIDGNKRRVWLSTMKIDDTWTRQPACLIDAYRSTVLRTVPADMGYLSTLPANSAISVVNTETYCRGGSNRSALDKYFTGADGTTIDIFRSDLGKPATAIGRPSMRTYCRNANSQMLSYDQYKNILYWLYVVEYANFNCLETFNSALTSEGYKQGGMGSGLTTMSGWEKYNYYHPICPMGYTNELGNGTGFKNISLPAFTYTNSEGVEATTNALTLKAIRWRGFENPFGDIWTNLDGIVIDADADNHPNNMNYVYTCLDATKFADTITEDYKKVGEEIHTDGYIKLFDLGETALIIPLTVGASSTTSKCDYHYTGNKNTTLRTLIVGGDANYGSRAGLAFFYSYFGVSYSGVNVGFQSSSPLTDFSVATFN